MPTRHRHLLSLSSTGAPSHPRACASDGHGRSAVEHRPGRQWHGQLGRVEGRRAAGHGQEALRWYATPRSSWHSVPTLSRSPSVSGPVSRNHRNPEVDHDFSGSVSRKEFQAKLLADATLETLLGLTYDIQAAPDSIGSFGHVVSGEVTPGSLSTMDKLLASIDKDGATATANSHAQPNARTYAPFTTYQPAGTNRCLILPVPSRPFCTATRRLGINHMGRILAGCQISDGDCGHASGWNPTLRAIHTHGFATCRRVAGATRSGN